jgi:hypothetical protein
VVVSSRDRAGGVLVIRRGVSVHGASRVGGRRFGEGCGYVEMTCITGNACGAYCYLINVGLDTSEGRGAASRRLVGASSGELRGFRAKSVRISNFRVRNPYQSVKLLPRGPQMGRGPTGIGLGASRLTSQYIAVISGHPYGRLPSRPQLARHHSIYAWNGSDAVRFV